MPALVRLAVSVVTVSLLAACSGGEEPNIKVAPARIGTVVEIVEAPASVAARAAATLSAPADGRVAELAVKDGQPVKTGQLILRIDSSEAMEQLRQAKRADEQAAASSRVSFEGLSLSDPTGDTERQAAEAFEVARKAAEQITDPSVRAEALAALARADAQAQALRADADRAVRRFNAGLGSLADALSALGASQRVQTRAAVAVAQRTVDALAVKAPIDGVVSLGAASRSGGGTPDLSGLPQSLQGAAEALGAGAAGAAGAGDSAGGAVGTLAIGTPISAGQSLVTITDVSELSLIAEVDETDVLMVHNGLTATAELDALPETTYDAKVTSVDVSPVATSRGGVAYRVRLSLGAGTSPAGEAAPIPRPGMSAVVSLRVKEARGVVTVPSSAIVRVGDRDAVWLVVDGVARRRFVAVGAQGAGTVEITQGLNAGQQVVVRGADRVSDGQRLDQ